MVNARKAAETGLTSGVARLEGECIDEEVEVDGVPSSGTASIRAQHCTRRVTWRYQGNSRRVGFGGGREAAQGDELSVDVVKHVCPDFADICDPSTLLANSEP